MELGTGNLYIHEPLEITGTAGTVTSVDVSENESVTSGTDLLTLENGESDTEYQELLAQRQAYSATLKKLLQLSKNQKITAEISGTVQNVNVSAGSSQTESSGNSTGSTSAGSSSGTAVSKVSVSNTVASVVLSDLSCTASSATHYASTVKLVRTSSETFTDLEEGEREENEGYNDTEYQIAQIVNTQSETEADTGDPDGTGENSPEDNGDGNSSEDQETARLSIFIRNADLQNSSYVVVITADTATELLGRTDVVGESISLDRRKFLVVGVLDENSTSSLTSGMAVISSSSDEDSDSSVSLEGDIPYSTMTRITDNVLDVTQFYASASREDTLDYAKEALTRELLERFEKDEDAFSVTDQSEIMDTMESVTNTMSLMIGGIAAISLLVGGIGIMNIMLVSVTERTKEIGIRKAIGAGRGTIMLQFLIEALLVSMMGCMIGIGVSWAGLKIAGQFMQSSMNLAYECSMDFRCLFRSDRYCVRTVSCQ